MKLRYLRAILFTVLAFASAAAAQAGRETYTGTILSYGSGFNTRMSTGTFTLTIDRYTSDDRARRLFGLLQEGAEDRLLNELDNENVGSFSVNGQIGPRINVARESMV